MTADAVAINRTRAAVLLDDDTVIPFETMWDAFGDETDDCDAAVSAIFPLADGRWCAIDLTAFDPVAVH